MIVLAVDPGTEQSAWLLYDTDAARPTEFGLEANDVVSDRLFVLKAGHLAVEMVACYGMAVGHDVFETAVWIGRFIEAWKRWRSLPWSYVYRLDVKMHLCHSPRAKDANVRQALIDRWGGKQKAVGLKKTPGPLYGLKDDLWAALGVAVTWAETRNAGP